MQTRIMLFINKLLNSFGKVHRLQLFLLLPAIAECVARISHRLGVCISVCLSVCLFVTLGAR